MIKIFLNGCAGKMGAAVTEAVKTAGDMEIIGGIDITTDVVRPYPVYTSFSDIPECGADALIDFSNPSALTDMLSYCTAHSLPAVICTTGLSDEQKNELRSASEKIPVFFSANMSIGVNLLVELAKTAAKILGNDFDIEIVEQHHNQKLDAPSGTALMIADAIKSELPPETYYEYDRHSKREKRNPSEIGIHAIRGGTITGEHEVIFAGNDEIVKISHSARSKALFATGAVNAARFVAGKVPGMYDMSDLIKAR